VSDRDVLSRSTAVSRRARRLSRRTLLAGLPLLAAPAIAAPPLVLRVGTSGESGGFAAYGDAFADAIKWANPSINVRLERGQGSAENAALLQEGRLDVGLVSGEVAHQLFNAPAGPPNDLTVVSVAFSSPGMFAVRAESRYQAIAELRDRPVVWTVRGSAAALQARYTLEPLGLDMERDFDPIFTDRMTDGVALMLDGRASAMWGIGKRWAGFVAVAGDPRGARFVTPGPEESKTIVERYRFLHRAVVPAGRYRRQFEAIQTIGSWSYLLAGPQLGDDAGYALAAARRRCRARAACNPASRVTSAKSRRSTSRSTVRSTGRSSGRGDSSPARAGGRAICCRGGRVRPPVSLPARSGAS